MAQDDPNDEITVPVSAVARFYCIAGFGLVAVFLMSAAVYTAFHNGLSFALSGAEWALTFLANLVVLYFALPALKHTKARSWLYVVCAAVIFVCLALLRWVASAMRLNGTEAHWLHIVRPLGGIIGLVFYTCGIVTLARQTKSRRMPAQPNQSLEVTAGQSVESP